MEESANTFTSFDEYRAARAVELSAYFGTPARAIKDEALLLFAQCRGHVITPKTIAEHIHAARQIIDQPPLMVSINGVKIGYVASAEWKIEHGADKRSAPTMTVTLPPIKVDRFAQ